MRSQIGAELHLGVLPWQTEERGGEGPPLKPSEVTPALQGTVESSMAAGCLQGCSRPLTCPGDTGVGLFSISLG